MMVLCDGLPRTEQVRSDQLRGCFVQTSRSQATATQNPETILLLWSPAPAGLMSKTVIYAAKPENRVVQKWAWPYVGLVRTVLWIATLLGAAGFGNHIVVKILSDKELSAMGDDTLENGFLCPEAGLPCCANFEVTSIQKGIKVRLAWC